MLYKTGFHLRHVFFFRRSQESPHAVADSTNHAASSEQVI